jgi:hypothetical protein
LGCWVGSVQLLLVSVRPNKLDVNPPCDLSFSSGSKSNRGVLCFGEGDFEFGFDLFRFFFAVSERGANKDVGSRGRVGGEMGCLPAVRRVLSFLLTLTDPAPGSEWDIGEGVSLLFPDVLRPEEVRREL